MREELRDLIFIVKMSSIAVFLTMAIIELIFTRRT